MTASQRWRDGRSGYRPPGERIETASYEVALIADDTTAKDFVVRHHYAQSYPAARFRVGLFHVRRGLEGVAVFSVPCNPRALDVVPEADPMAKVELGRLVLLNYDPVMGSGVKHNGESWFIGRAFELLRHEGIVGVVSFSDPMPRALPDGTLLKPGHVGTIYQATNASYLGQSRPRWLRLLPDGSVLHNRAVAKIRARDQGCEYASRALVRFGAEPLRDDDDPYAWLAEWIPRTTRRVLHPGNHKYAFGLDKRVRRHLPPSLPYPKLHAT